MGLSIDLVKERRGTLLVAGEEGRWAPAPYLPEERRREAGLSPDRAALCDSWRISSPPRDAAIAEAQPYGSQSCRPAIKNSTSMSGRGWMPLPSTASSRSKPSPTSLPVANNTRDASGGSP